MPIRLEPARAELGMEVVGGRGEEDVPAVGHSVESKDQCVLLRGSRSRLGTADARTAAGSRW